VLNFQDRDMSPVHELAEEFGPRMVKEAMHEVIDNWGESDSEIEEYEQRRRRRGRAV
jgi:hypothetical protein